MNTFSWKWSIAIALVACSCGAAGPVRADDPEKVDLAEITRRLTDWRASFVNVRVVWELRSLPESKEDVDEWPPPPDPETARLFARKEWIWADHGLNRLEHWFFFHQDGSSKVHAIDAFNGPKGLVFRAQFQKPTEEGPEKFLDLQIFDLGVGKPISRIELDATEGLYWPGFAQWLPELLSESEWKFEEIDELCGERCARIARHVSMQPPLTDYVQVLWLDLNHDSLVRSRRERSLAGEWTAGGRDFIVDEFQRLDSRIWFPKRGRTQLGGMPHENHLFVVTDAAVNESVDLARFDPPAPAVGTAVVDQLHQRSYRHGVDEVAAQQQSSRNMGGQATSTDAEIYQKWHVAPPTPSWVYWSIGLVSVSVLFLILGFWFSHRRTGG